MKSAFDKTTNYWTFFPWVMFVAGLCFTVFAARYVWLAGEAEDRQSFYASTLHISDAITSEMEVYESVLRGTAAFWGASDFVSQSDFQTYTGRLLLKSRYPGMQGVGYLEKLEIPPNTVSQSSSSGLNLPNTSSGTSETVMRVKYLEPRDRRNLAAIGFNSYGESNRRIAMNRAGDTGIPALSAPVILKQEVDELKQPGFILYLPVYNNGGIPSTLINRRKQLSGYVYSPFRSHDLFRAILKKMPPTAINLQVLDVTSTKSILLFSSNGK